MSGEAPSPAPRRLKIVEVAHVDYALDNFVRPLMLALAARGHEVLGVSADGPLLAQARAQGLRIETVEMRRRSANPLGHAAALAQLVRLFRRERPDIVHAHMPVSGILARLAARMAGVPGVAYTSHGFHFRRVPGRAGRAAYLSLERLCGRLTDLFMTVSEEEAEIARRHGIHPHPFATGNGVDETLFRPGTAAERAAFRAELGLAPDALLIAIASRLVAAKGHPELLQALRSVPGAVLLVAGAKLPTDPEDGLEAAFAEAEADPARAGRVLRLGYRSDLARIFGAADIFALPSHYEALPVSIIEAMMCGLAVVTTDIVGPREQVEHGVSGLLLPPGDVPALAAALNGLAGDPARRAEMGRMARERALARYRASEVTGRVVAALERLGEAR
jgi:glycosyltransferase involved in cell wall biosynthesis